MIFHNLFHLIYLWLTYNGVSLKVSYALEDSCNEDNLNIFVKLWHHMKDDYMGFQLATYLKLIPRRPLIHGDGVHKQCILRNIPTHLKWIKLTLTVLEENFPTHVTNPLGSEICLFFDRRFFMFFRFMFHICLLTVLIRPSSPMARARSSASSPVRL